MSIQQIKITDDDNYKAVEEALTTGPSLSMMTKEVDAQDLNYQGELYRQLLCNEYNICSDQLRHRADMMRRRADEFDEIADSMIKIANEINGRVHDATKTYENTLSLLASHAHIKPTRIDGG